jgi:hypothetical protein
VTIDLAQTSSRRRVAQWTAQRFKVAVGGGRVPLGYRLDTACDAYAAYGWADAVMLHAPCAPSLPETQLAPVVRARGYKTFLACVLLVLSSSSRPALCTPTPEPIARSLDQGTERTRGWRTTIQNEDHY